MYFVVFLCVDACVPECVWVHVCRVCGCRGVCVCVDACMQSVG